jgi:hypothetical protein
MRPTTHDLKAPEKVASSVEVGSLVGRKSHQTRTTMRMSLFCAEAGDVPLDDSARAHMFHWPCSRRSVQSRTMGQVHATGRYHAQERGSDSAKSGY